MDDPGKEEDLALRQRLLNDIHRSFKEVVLDARGAKLKIAEDRAFSGEVFTGREAVEHGEGVELHKYYVSPYITCMR